MYGVAGEKRPIFYESDAFLHNLVDPIIYHYRTYYHTGHIFDYEPNTLDSPRFNGRSDHN